MSSQVMVKQSKGVRVIGLLTIIAGIVMILAGGFTWWTVADQLSAEQITVSEDASFLAGRHVNDPFSAYAQAEVINKHALEATDGQTYAELPQDDPRREIVMNASFLRASLFTSVVAFGVAALVVGLGVLFILVGWALRRLADGPDVATGTAMDGAPGTYARDDVPSAPAPRHQSPPAATNPAQGTTPPAGTTPSAGTMPPAGTTRATEGTTATAPGSVSGGVAPDAPTNPQAPRGSSTTDGRPNGWASPADRVPPVDGTSDGTGTR